MRLNLRHNICNSITMFFFSTSRFCFCPVWFVKLLALYYEKRRLICCFKWFTNGIWVSAVNPFISNHKLDFFGGKKQKWNYFWICVSPLAFVTHSWFSRERSAAPSTQVSSTQGQSWRWFDLWERLNLLWEPYKTHHHHLWVWMV